MPVTRLCPECQAELPSDAPDGLCAQCQRLHGLSTISGRAATGKESGTPAYHGIFTAPEPAELAGSFPQLEIVELLGRGGMGAVYKARQPGLDRLIALKILPPEAGRDPAFAERFTREARALARLNHPHIVTVYDFGQSGGLYYFAMEYVDGTNLRQFMRSGDLRPEMALAIVPQVCDALQFAHDEGIVHRDIKPENILLDKKGRAKIADFGIAKLLGQNTGVLTGPWQVMGTLHYMAPEQMDNPLQVDHRADIYSLGVVLYEMLTGQLPLGRFPLPSQKAALDARLDEVVLRALENDPAGRFQTAREVKTAVEAITRPDAAVPLAMQPAEELAGAEQDLDEIRRRVMAPATGLMVTGILSLLPLLVMGIISLFAKDLGTAGWVLTVIFSLSGLVGGTILLGSLMMMRLKWLPLALVSSMLAMLPVQVGCFVGLPMGLWAFLVLRKREVMAAFHGQRLQPQSAEYRQTAARPRTPVTGARSLENVTPRRPPAVPTQEWDAKKLGGVITPTSNQEPRPAPDRSTGGPPIPSVVPAIETTDVAAAREKVLAPAVALLIIGILNCVGIVGLIVGKVTGTGSVIGGGIVFGPLIIFGALKMRELAWYRFSLAASILAMVSPSLCIPAGIGIGIWALVVLVKPEVREAFRVVEETSGKGRR